MAGEWVAMRRGRPRSGQVSVGNDGAGRDSRSTVQGQRQATTDPAARLQRCRAFTLLEILVVVAIISVLIALAAVALGRAVSSARAAATRSTISKINAILEQRRDAFSRLKPSPQRVRDMQSYYGLASPKLAETVFRKLAYKALFPQRVEDLYGADGAPGGTGAAQDAPLAAKLPSPLPPHVSSAELLYLAVTEGSLLGGEEVATDQFSTSEVADTDGDGMKEFVDGWGRPIRFYRWPTRLIRPAAAGAEVQPQAILNPGDPVDAQQYRHAINPQFVGPGFPNKPGVTAEVLLGTLPPAPPGVMRGPGTTLGAERSDPLAVDPDDQFGLFAAWSGLSEADWHTPATFHQPLIVSAGPDQVLGVYEPDDVAQFGTLAQPKWQEIEGILDNITNRNLQTGGK